MESTDVKPKRKRNNDTTPMSYPVLALEIRKMCERHGITVTGFGRMLSDDSFVQHLERGEANLTTRTFRRLRSIFRELEGDDKKADRIFWRTVRDAFHMEPSDLAEDNRE